MIQTMKRSLALLIALMMCLSLLPALLVGVSADEFSYVRDGKYIYNWGTRGEVATFLSPNAEEFYTDATYEELVTYSGGTGTSDAPKSDLYTALQTLMKDAHTYETDYGETRYLYKYTDCQNNGANGGRISSFYSGKDIGPAWDGGTTWNREHTWPNSKGLGGNDENDIMMLRPTASSENGARSNKAYGKSAGYYYPNVESNDKYDVRGDVARIFLYVYVRWGNVNGNGEYTAWGARGVMESVEVLLEWMEADPVDTWELGRNDSVEAITGTRNVFIDYPELAFLLFGEEIPSDMTTPSGEAANTGDKCDHDNFDKGVTVAPTCTQKGFTLFTCQTANCGYSYKTSFTATIGHIYVEGVCSACGEAEPAAPTKPTYVTELIPGKAYKLGLYSTDKNAEYFFSGTMNGYYGATDTSFDNGVDVFVETTSGGYHMYFVNGNGQKQYINLVVSGTYRNFTFDSTATSVFTWDSTKNALYTTLADEICYIGTYSYYVTMGVLQSSKLQNNDYIARFYVMGAGSDTPSCEHNYTITVVAPTCDAEGYTLYTCTLCNDMYMGEKTPAQGHTYAGGACIRCGAEKPTQTEFTISFDTTENRTVFNTSQQVWVQNGITVTNDKAGAGSNVADYCKPARFYKGSNVTISFPGMTQIVINCKGLDSQYVNSWLNVSAGKATNNGGIITIVFDTPVDSLVYTGLAKQSRAYSITVYAKAETEECDHANYIVEEATAATCTTPGHTGKIYCPDCKTVLEESKEIPALGHKEVEHEGKAPTCTAPGLTGEVYCSECKVLLEESKEIPALGHKEVEHEGKAPTCTETGWEAYVTCERCDYTTYVELIGTHVFDEWVQVKAPTCTAAGLERKDCDNCTEYETREIAALGHKDENGDSTCDICNGSMLPEKGEDTETDEHVCGEVSGFKAFINKIINFFRRLFGQPELCPCGEVILEKKD